MAIAGAEAEKQLETWDLTSLAGRIAQAFLDTSHHSAGGEFPPLLSARTAFARINLKHHDERGLSPEAFDRRVESTFAMLVRLADQGLVEILPVPDGKNPLEQVGFKMTAEGVKSALDALHAHAATLSEEAHKAAALVLQESFEIPINQ